MVSGSGLLRFCGILVLFLHFCSFTPLLATDVPSELLDLSLEELMQVEVYSGSITGTERKNIPVATTVITRNMIRTTPARNLLDLIEIYVPGATYVNHFMGPRIGFRGVLGDQNYSFLLLVNGRDMNLRMLQGPQYELENKELNDIKRIEIIRGPGSVTYGPGAIGGVINIITTSTEDAPEGVLVNAESNLGYRYNNGFVQYAHKTDNLKIMANASFSRSTGLKDSKFYYVCWADVCGYGFMDADWGSQGYGSPAPNMMADFDDRPEYKFDFDMLYKDRLRLWMRYTSFEHIKLIQEQSSLEGPAFSGIEGASFIAMSEYGIDLSEKVHLDASAGFDSKRYRDHALMYGSQQPFDDVLQRSASFSENIISGRLVGNYSPSDHLELALGSEAEYQWYGPEWGEDKNTFLYRFQVPLMYVVLDPSSEFHQHVINNNVTTVLEDAPDGHMVSFFGEANWNIHDRTVLLLSARADKHVYADWALSPRIAVMTSLNDANHLRAVLQQSVRLPLFSDLFSQDYISNGISETERVTGVELAYTRFQTANLQFTATGYYNIVDQVAWLSEEEQAGRVGTFESVGFELEGAWSVNGRTIGGNYSFIDQLSWDAAAPTDAYLTNMGPDSIQVSLGDAYATNRMNNLPRHAIKLFYDQDFGSRFHVHVDGRAYWKYGQIDMLEMFKLAHAKYGTDHTQEVMNTIYDEMLDHGYTRPSFTSNIQVGYTLPCEKVDATLSLYAMNLLSVNHVRYVIQYWAAGNQRMFPRQCGFVEEPAVFGATLQIRL